MMIDVNKIHNGDCFEVMKSFMEYENRKSIGRWPANVILDREAGAMLDAQSEDVSRFFYCPKVSISERNLGCDEIDSKAQNSENNIRTYNDRCGNCGKKFIGAKGSICSCPPGEKVTDKTVYTNRNNHPTVKPVDLMRYLCRLTNTPTGGIVLDPFCGSGSTLIAAKLEGRPYIGIERDPGYFKIAQARVANWKKFAIMEKDKKAENIPESQLDWIDQMNG